MEAWGLFLAAEYEAELSNAGLSGLSLPRRQPTTSLPDLFVRLPHHMANSDNAVGTLEQDSISFGYPDRSFRAERGK
jgi:hypothetical protein